MTSLPTPRTLNKSLAASLMAASLEDPEPDPKAPDTSRASQRPGTGRLPGVRTSGGKVKLRDLDPHLEVLEARPPSQQLHGNWPDGLKRQVVRHFYGMTPEQIRNEELKERLRHHKQRATLKDIGLEDLADATGEQGAAAGGNGANVGSPGANARRKQAA